ncbi:MAG TPA: RDD family protein [Rhodanobacter sp.]|nr:RDD family protein [Rhodanobacter sp.]
MEYLLFVEISMQRFTLFCKRLLALFVDYIVLTTVNAVLQPLLMIGYLIAASPGPGGGVRNGALVSLLLGGQLVPAFVYFWLFHACCWHATPGKLLMGIELREAGSRPLTTRAIAKRSLYALLTLLSAGLGYVWVLFDRRGLALHDHLGASVVVRRDADTTFAVPAASLAPSATILIVLASYVLYAVAVIPCALVISQVLR